MNNNLLLPIVLFFSCLFLLAGLPVYSEPVSPTKLAPVTKPCSTKIGGKARPRLPQRWIAGALLEPATNEPLKVAVLQMNHSYYASDAHYYTGLRVTTYLAESPSQPKISDKIYIRANTPRAEVSVHNLSTDAQGRVTQCAAEASYVNVTLPTQDIIGEGVADGYSHHTAKAPGALDFGCSIEAPLAQTSSPVQAQWWKKRSKALTVAPDKYATDWFWFDTSETSYGKLWRTMIYNSESSGYAFWRDYSTIYYPFFETAQSQATNEFDSIIAFCFGSTTPHPSATNPQRDKIKTWLSNNIHPAPGPESVANLEWPEQFALGTYFTAVNYDTTLSPAAVYYESAAISGDFARMNSRLYTPTSRAYTDVKEARLLGPVGYALGLDDKGIPNSCNIDVLPGAVIPQWGKADLCQPRVQIKSPAPQLGIKNQAVIYSCAIAEQWFWIWYDVTTNPQTPITFMQASADISQGTGLSLADYTRVVANGQIPATGADSTMLTVPPASAGCPKRAPKIEFPVYCKTCHMPIIQH